MKKKVSIVIAVLAAVVLVWGIVAASINLCNSVNSYKVVVSEGGYAKDGRTKTTTEADKWSYGEYSELSAEAYNALSAEQKALYNEAKDTYNKLYVYDTKVELITSLESTRREIKNKEIKLKTEEKKKVETAEKNLAEKEKALAEYVGTDIGKTQAETAVKTAKATLLSQQLSYASKEQEIKRAKTQKGITESQYFLNSASVFFSTYFPVVIFLLIGLAINQKLDYGCGCKKKESAPVVNNPDNTTPNA